MSMAAEHLARGSAVKDVCFKVGMTDPYHFSKLFKSVWGKSPRAYARQFIDWEG